MIQFSLQNAIDSDEVGKEPIAVMHDLYKERLFTNDGLKNLLESVPEQSIKTKTPYQNRGEEFGTHLISRQKLFELLDDHDKDCWIVLHEIESNPVIKSLYNEMVMSLESQLPAKYGKVKYCTGSIFISRGKASTPYHIDYGSVFLLQVRGRKQFLAYSPNDRELVPKQSLQELFSGHPHPPSLKYDSAFDEKALIIDLEPGKGIYLPSTSPHSTKTDSAELSVTIGLSYVCSQADRIRRSNTFDSKLPTWKFMPEIIKCGVVASYEYIMRNRSGFRVRHKSFRPLPL